MSKTRNNTGHLNSNEQLHASTRTLPKPLVRPGEHPFRFLANLLRSLPWTVVMTYVGVCAVAGFYYLMTQTTDTMNNAWHNLVSDDSLRHNIRDVGEGLFGGLAGQIIIWNHYKKSVSKPPNLLDKIEHKLGIPNPKDDKELSAWQVVYTIPLIFLYGIPGFLVARWLSIKLGHPMDEVTGSLAHVNIHTFSSVIKNSAAGLSENWPVKFMGYGAAFFFGRRPAKGIFDDVQLELAKLRVSRKQPVRWYHPPVFQARYNSVNSDPAVALMQPSPVRLVFIRVGIVVTFGLAVFGWYVLNYIAK